MQPTKDRSLKPRTALGDWVSAIAFAIIAATMVHTYVMQPYTIPSSSLEKTLLTGDYLFVSKFHYGARVDDYSGVSYDSRFYSFYLQKVVFIQ